MTYGGMRYRRIRFSGPLLPVAFRRPEASTRLPECAVTRDLPSSSLFTPLALGPRTAPNRIVFGTHLTNFAHGNRFTGRHEAYYQARAAGGAGILVLEALAVHPLDRPQERVLAGDSDALLPSLSRLVACLRTAAPAALVLAHLTHSGGQSSGKILRQSPWAPSPVPDVASRRMPREMTAPEIREVIAAFGTAARRAAASGVDGVELNAGQRSLARQFLSPLTNLRQDDWGGPLEHRLRFLLETLAEVRSALGPGLVLGLKLCGDELAPWGGLTPEDAGEIARRVVGAGGVNYLSIQIGGPYSEHATESGLPTPQGHGADLAGRVRDAIAGALPVWAEGRIESLSLAARLVAESRADAVVMTRALVSDPDLPRKAQGLDPEPIRPHVGMVRYFSIAGDWNRPVGDLANPRAGRESRLPPWVRKPDRVPVLVVGAGVAGLEAATTLARLGRDVTVWEQHSAPGGLAAALGRALPGREAFAALVDYYLALARHQGVRIEMARTLRADTPGLELYDELYLALGAQAPGAGYPVSDVPVFTPRALISGAVKAETLPPPASGIAVVVDLEWGFRMGAAVEWLLERGYPVAVLSPDFSVGRELIAGGDLDWFRRVAQRGAVLHPRTLMRGVSAGGVLCADRFSGQERRISPVSLVVHAAPEVPAGADLAAALALRHPRVVTLGDARAPRLMGEAIAHAHRTALGGSESEDS